MATREVPLDECLDHIASMQIDRRIDEVIIHHTWRPSAGQYRGYSTVEGVRRYHMSPIKAKLKGTCPQCGGKSFRHKPNRKGWICRACGAIGSYGRGWSDAGYHITVAPNADIFLCRPMQRSGAHCKYHNTHSIGLSYIANFDAQDPETYDGLETGAEVVAALLKRFSLGVHQVNFHRDFANKSCPGTKLELGHYRRLVAKALAGDAAREFVMVLLPGSQHAFDCVARSPEAMAALRELNGADIDFIPDHLTDDDPKAYLRKRPR